MLLNILLVILVLDCVALTCVILMQRSEGGALGMGGGPSGMFTARGAGDLLTRMTAVFTTVFFVLSLGITLLAGHSRENASLTQKLKVNPIDISALAAGSSAPAQAPAASSSAAAPPLPGAAPPLPGSAPLPGFGGQPAAGPPQLRQQVRPSAPPPSQKAAPAAPTGAFRNTTPAIAKPAPLVIPPPPTTSAPAATPPASPAPSGQ